MEAEGAVVAGSAQAESHRVRGGSRLGVPWTRAAPRTVGGPDKCCARHSQSRASCPARPCGLSAGLGRNPARRLGAEKELLSSLTCGGQNPHRPPVKGAQGLPFSVTGPKSA